MADATTEEFYVGDVLKRTFRVFSRNIVSFGMIALVILIVPNLILYGLIPDSPAEPLRAGDNIKSEFAGLDIWAVFRLLIYILLAQFLAAALIYGTVQDIRGNRASLVDCFTQAYKVIIPVLGVAIIATLAVWIAALALIIPGLIVAVILCAAVPVAVIEKPGVLNSLRRSWQLTKGYRWKLAGIFLIILISQGVIEGLWQAFSPMIPILDIIITHTTQVLFSILFAIVTAVIYFRLRFVKEGIDIEDIAAVFD